MSQETASSDDVARLFGRAAFGATAADLDSWQDKPYADVVDHLLDIPDPALRAPLPDDARRIVLERGSTPLGVVPRTQDLEGSAQRWWLERMRTTTYPLEERMVLFWHDHFATALGEVFPDVGQVMRQNQTLRVNALGNFRAMCEQITVDPAMLYWLSGAESRVGKPNENYGREFFELFTLGTIPQVYSETDIRESARALTGWVVDGLTGNPSFQVSRHDRKQKTVLGTTFGDLGEAEYKKIVDIALSPRVPDVSPLFVAYKLVLNFAYVPDTVNISADPLISKVAASLSAASTRWSLKAAVRTMLVAPEFRDAAPSQGRQVVRQPIELVVNACKSIGISADNNQVLPLLGRMGQVPFQPPNVGGWPFGRDWLSPVTTLARYDWGVKCYELWSGTAAPLRPALPASNDLGAWESRFGLGRPLSDNTRTAIQSYLGARPAATEAERQAGVLILIASSPDWMVM